MQPIKAKQLAILMPASGPIEPECVESLMNLEMPRGWETRFFMDRITTPLDRARVALVKRAQTWEADYILFVASDMIYPKETITDLLHVSEVHDAVAAGLYRSRTDGRYLAYIREFGRKAVHWLTEADMSELVMRIDGCGSDCMLLPASVFDKLQEPWFQHFHGGSEDVFFCEELRSHSIPLFLDTTLRCGHITRQILEA